jgi:hypothetical protein
MKWCATNPDCREWACNYCGKPAQLRQLHTWKAALTCAPECGGARGRGRAWSRECMTNEFRSATMDQVSGPATRPKAALYSHTEPGIAHTYTPKTTLT